MKIPNGALADVGTKLEKYCLNPLHRLGRHKARAFESILGIALENKEILSKALREAAGNSMDAVDLGDNGFGRVYSLKFDLVTETGAAKIMSIWIILRNETFPKLVTAI